MVIPSIPGAFPVFADISDSSTSDRSTVFLARIPECLVPKSCCLSFPHLDLVTELEIVIINAKIMYWTHFPDLFRVSIPLNVRHLGYKCQYFSRILRQNHWLNFNQNSHTSRKNYCHQFVVFV